MCVADDAGLVVGRNAREAEEEQKKKREGFSSRTLLPPECAMLYLHHIARYVCVVPSERVTPSVMECQYSAQ